VIARPDPKCHAAHGMIRGATKETIRYLTEKPGAINWSRTDISMSQFNAALKTYIADFGTRYYGAGTLNSNYFVNSVISRAGGNPTVTGSWNPQCARVFGCVPATR
jgi:hypothetical protein